MDPYRVLGLEPGASQAEIKRAYRRLAKALHPDSAGERSLPAFLAVQEAYEQLVGPSGRGGLGGTSRGARASGASGRASRSGASGGESPGWQEPWRADPERARAAREQARARWRDRPPGSWGPRGQTAPGQRGSATGAAGGTAGGAGGATGGGGGRSGQAASGRGAGPGQRRRQGGSEWASDRSGDAESGTRSSRSADARGEAGRGRRRATRKATLGSTSYDEARDASDPRWAGASWYGPTTGEYWIVNPREYADPRKHGPGYSGRGRAGWTGSRAWAPDGDAGAGRTPADLGRDDLGRDDPGAADLGPDERERGDPRDAAGPGATHGARDGTGVGARPGNAGAPPATPTSGASFGDATAARPSDAGPWFDPDRWWRLLVEPGPADATHRAGLALVAWPPIGLAVAGIVNALTGCATYAVGCDGTDQLLPWLAQAAIVGLLLLMPILARVLAAGTIGLLLGLVPGTAVLIAFGGAHADAAGAVLALLASIAWLIGVGWAIRVILRRT